MINCIIVEDQPPAQRLLQKYVSDTEGLELKSTFSSPLDAMLFLKTEQIDLIFLDVHLPKISGMEFLKLLDNPPQVILTTAFENYAIEAFELNVVDYLLKPFSYSRFLASVEKVMSRNNEPQVDTAGQDNPDNIFVKDGHNYLNLQINAILYIKAEGDYTSVHKENDRIVVAYSIKYWENKLGNKRFFRIHKSYLINTNHIEKISGNVVILTNGNEVPIGRKYKDEFFSNFLS